MGEPGVETPTAEAETPAFATSSGIELRRVYSGFGPEAVPTADLSWERDRLGRAGEFPFTRGIHGTMYRGRPWTMRQYAGYGTASETNERFQWLLGEGQTGLSTAFDLPTQMGLDADDPKAKGEVGRVGVHIGTLEDMEGLFEAIPLQEVSTSLTINATASLLVGFYVALAKKRGVALEALRGTVQNDILKEFIARGTQIFPLEPSLRLAVDLLEYGARHLPQFHPISISGYHIREAGADAVQELAFTFANAEVYVQKALERGLGMDAFGPRLAFFFGCHNHFLEEIAKFRAARRIWARLARERFGAKDPKTLALKFHVQICGSTLTGRQPMNNVTRVAVQAMAAVLGGAQSLHTNAYDEALALPSEESARIALRTQQVLACETGVADTVDPVGGAYTVEALTEELERRAEEKLSKIRSEGGMLRAIATGTVQREIQESAYRFQQETESGRRKVVGVNCYEGGDMEKTPAILKVSPKLEERQRSSLARFKKNRPGRPVGEALGELRDAASRPKENLVPFILSAIEKKATLGEICGALRGIFGEYHAS